MSNWKKVKVLFSSRSGFSLLEILIALTLMGIAATFVAGRVFKSLNEGRISAAKIQMEGLAERLKEFRRHCNFYPTSDQGLEALVSKPGGRDCKNYQPGGYLEGSVPLDPWDNPYVYTSDGNTFNIMSYGSDGQPGGTDENADIYLYEQKTPGSAGQPAPPAESPQ
jgi:general secretion pathway protein G